MPIIKKDESMPARPVTMVLYGVPGVGKTSIANTSENPLLIDTDRGSTRASNRVDTLVVSTWEEVIDAKPDMKSYKTIICDTARSISEDFLEDYVIKKNYKLKTNSLKRYGEMGSEFKSFVNYLRSNNSDIIFVCHDKETTEGDIIRHAPDGMGQAKDLLLRIADQVGFITMVNGKRTIVFDPTDTSVGKNVAQIPPTVVPDCNSSEFMNFAANLIKQVKLKTIAKTEEQVKAQAQLEEATAKLESAKTLKDANELIDIANALPKPMQAAFKKKVAEDMKKLGFVIKDGKFIKNE